MYVSDVTCTSMFLNALVWHCIDVVDVHSAAQGTMAIWARLVYYSLPSSQMRHNIVTCSVGNTEHKHNIETTKLG